jgi:DNA-binding NtrC family response regulator
MAAHTKTQKPVVLVVDDEYRTFQSLPGLISPEAYTVVWVPDALEGLKTLGARPEGIDIVIVDLKSSGMGGGGFLHQARQVAPDAAILITGPLGHFLYHCGLFYDFSGPSLRRDINTVLSGIAQNAWGRGRGERRKHLRSGGKDRMGAIIGRSQSINELYALIERLGSSLATVLIQGESGTGKELVARTIHETSSRRHGPFVAINCGAIPPSLMETELFGHERGAFTTALSQRKGKFEAADGGTLFLDEIGELDRELQVKLLRVLQEKEFQRVGGNRTCKTDVRIIAASSRNLREEVNADRFRDDLFYRLNVVPMHVPPLRERKDDIPLLLDHFFRKFSSEQSRPSPSLTKDAFEAMVKYRYPGNVRELANIVERLLVICPGRDIALSDLPVEVQGGASGGGTSSEVLKELPEEGVSLREVEKELILKTLQKTSGNKLAAARMLGITRRLLYLRLGEYGLHSC